MYKRTILASILIGSSAIAVADPGLFLGVTYAFGQSSPGVGLSLKVMSTNREDKVAVGAGVNYYPWLSGNKFGVSADVGYVFQNAAVTAGWDFMHSPVVSVGYMNTKGDKPAAVLID